MIHCVVNSGCVGGKIVKNRNVNIEFGNKQARVGSWGFGNSRIDGGNASIFSVPWCNIGHDWRKD